MDVVTGAMGSLLPKLGELLVGEYKLQKGVKEDVESLQREMRSMNAALSTVAEVPRDQLHNQVILWADELRELSYDMEDVVDNFLVYVEGSDVAADANKLKLLMLKMANLFTEGKTRHQIGNAIRNIKNRAQEVADRRDRYRVDDGVANAAGKHKVDPRVLALYKDKKELVGIEDAQNELTKRLTDGDGDVPKQQPKMKVVSIVGLGGLGKTTLAKSVYDMLQTQFKYTAFVPVGQNPEVKKVLRDILLEVDKSERIGDVATLDERQLIDKLQRRLENARYLVVIDDIWDLEAWNTIKCAFVDNNHGSRVITTTRILDVATNTSDIYKLKPLSQHLSEELFYTRLFGGKDKCPFHQPAEVSDKFLQKCGGVPLAIITIASLLAGKPVEEWSKVFDSIGFGSGDNTYVENTRKILSFSYYDLPCHLKSCLLHMSIYPEDYLIMKDILIWRWVAEGLVDEEPEQTLESHWNGYEPPQQLRVLLVEGGFSRFPAWINSSLLPNISSLCVTADLGARDVVILGSLPELTSLLERRIPGGMEFPDGAFPKLRSCRVDSPFRFLEGSMQSLESICIKVQVLHWYPDFDFIGTLRNLPSLQKVRAEISCNGAYASDFENVKAAVRKAIDTHPNRPTLDLKAFCQYMVDEVESDSEQTEQEVLPASSLDHTASVDTSAQVINDDDEEESNYEHTEQEKIDDDEEDEEESDSEQTKPQQESDHVDENRPTPHVTENSVDATSASPVHAQRRRWLSLPQFEQ